KSAFYLIEQFLNVIGAIECTPIRIQSPAGDNAEVFGNRKGYFSVNVQIVCNAHQRIRNIIA
ncbi:DDE Tnp 4 domain containing protein, partial [Asbolus verrucosus]